MKPYKIEEKDTRKVLGEFNSFSEGWEEISHLANCELIRTIDSVVLAHKNKAVDEHTPFVLLTSLASLMSTKN